MARHAISPVLCVLVSASTALAEEGAPPPPPAEAAPPPASAPEASAERLVLLFTSDTGAALVDPGCDEGAEAPLLPRIAAAVRRERAREGADRVVLVDAGDAAFPSPLARDLASDPPAARSLAEALSSAGYDAMAAGNTTVSAPVAALRGFGRAADEAGLPLLLANVACDAEAEGVACDSTLAGLTRRRVIIDRGTLRVGVFALLPEDLPARVARPNVEGTSFSEALEAARAAARALRAEGADLVVLLSHVDRSGTAPRRTLQLLSRLEPEEAPDLVVAASTAGLAIRIRTAGEGPPVLAVSGDTLGRAVLEREGDAGRWRLVDAGALALDEPPDDVLDRVLASWRAGYCARQARPLRGGALAGPMDEEDFFALVVRVCREQTGAELALLNTAMVSSRAFPIEGQLTPAHIRRALRFDNELRVATVRGERLAALAPRLLAADGIEMAGLSRRDATYFVNGRALDGDARYRVVTIDFIAEGGDGLIEDPEALGFEPAEPAEGGAVTVADRVAGWLELRPEGEELDPEARLDLHTRPLWYGAFALDIAISDTHIDDRAYEGEGYDQPQLRRQELLDMRLGLEARAGMSTRDHSWDNLVLLRYGRQRLETEVGSDAHEWGESSDLINVRSSYTMDHIRNHLLSGSWYGPSLFAEYNLESEFDHDGEGSHFLEMTGTGGLRLKPLDWLLLQAGAGVRSRVLEEDAAAEPGLTFRVEVRRTRFFGRVRAPIYLSGLVDYFLSWPGDGEAHKLITEGRVEIELLGPLRLSASLRFFVYDEPGQPLATAVDSTLGLTVALSHRLQMF